MPVKNSAKKEAEIKATVTEIMAAEQELADAQVALQQIPEFQKYHTMQQELNSKMALFWKTVETEMIDNNIKSIKGDFGTITVAERLSFDTNDELQPKFYKKVVDTKKLADTFRLTGKVPKGATPKYSKYLTKRLKGIEK